VSATGAALPTPEQGGFWPTPAQAWLLRAALATGDAARVAWERWQREVASQAELDPESTDLLPTVAWNLEREIPSDPLLPLLRPFRERTRAENEAHAARAGEVLAELAGEGIATLVLKGLALGPVYGGDPAARPMADVDIAVPTSRAVAAARLLARLGFRPERAGGAESLRFRHSLGFGRAEGSLDLHWHVCFESCAPGLDEPFWRSSRAREIAGVATRVLHPSEQLLHTILHGAKWNPLPSQRWIVDAALVVRREGAEIDWERMLALARQLRVGLRLRQACELLTTHLAVEVPAEVLRRLRAAPVSRLERRERSIAQRSRSALRRTPLGALRLVLADYRRLQVGSGALSRLAGLPRYLGYRWRLQGGRGSG